ncbi:MAG: AAA family ATPase [Burkholderiales bacterium]|nr:AAA family ATPase [Burkholderiales bacterium]MDE1926284.1 AAA family ATPase [Burkholderiales bacterium]MDE2502619.1 AAA family ATPase [Burkholderiales bacterium]
MLADLNRAREALRAIPPDLPRDEWVRAGMAAQAAGLEFDDFNEWSAQGGNYDERAARDTWRSFTPGKGVGPGTLYKMAAEHGGYGRRRQSPAQARRKPAEPRRRPAPGMSAAEVWGRCNPASETHPYIAAKAGRPDGLRVVPVGDPLRIAGEPVAGWLVVPVLPLEGGEPVSLQFIPPPGNGKKLNLPGAAMAGVFIVGDSPAEVEPGDTVFIVEGIGQAWACRRAVGFRSAVCFGAGRMRAVAAELRQRDASARLVLVPDAGKEADAEAIARDVGAEVVTMPEGSPKNFDANDYAQAEGFDALEELLMSSSAPERPSVPVHPLAKFVELDGSPIAPRWVIPGFIGHGLVIVAGSHGVGKTTALLPLAMVAAGLHAPGDELAPRHWRHVVYIVEDIEQARRIVAGIVGFGGLGLGLPTVQERLHMVEAKRMDPARVAEVGETYRERFTRTVDGVEVLPLVVFDTKAAVLAMDEENSNSEASAIVALLKQEFDSLPVWLVGHVAKANMSRADAAGLSLRGGSAFEADANQVLYLVKEADESRYLVRGKTRFEAQWPELLIRGDWATVEARDEFGNPERVTLRWGVAIPPEQSRKEAQEQAKEAARKAEAAAMRDEVRDIIETEWVTGCPLNREGVKGRAKRNRADVASCLESLIAEQWVIEVPVPPKERTNPKRAAFLVSLTPDEREAARRGEGLPPHKLKVPPTWRKSPAAVRIGETAPEPGKP